jgi:hypothetical protein
MTFEQHIAADEAKLKDYRSEIRHHELRIASFRNAIIAVEARIARLKEKAKQETA